MDSMENCYYITHRTAPITLLISGNHYETIQLLVISPPNSCVVLCLPWIKLHNPHVDQSSGSIVSWSIFCHSHGLKSAPVAVAVLLSGRHRFLLA